MKPILIQGAENSELNYLLEKLENPKELDIANFKFWTGTFDNYPIVLSRSKVGEINSAISTTIGIINFSPLCIINQGTSGAHTKYIKKNDLVIAENYFPITNFIIDHFDEGTGSSLENWKLESFISEDYEEVSKNATPQLLNFIKENKSLYSYGNIYFGTVGSGDIWNREVDRLHYLHTNYNTLCEEMEIAGVYTSANNFNIPVVSIRIISNNEFLNDIYEPNCSTKCQIFVENISKEIIKKLENI